MAKENISDDSNSNRNFQEFLMNSHKFPTNNEIPENFEQNFSRFYKQNSELLDYAIQQEEKSRINSRLNATDMCTPKRNAFKPQNIVEEEDTRDFSIHINPDDKITLDLEFRYYSLLIREIYPTIKDAHKKWGSWIKVIHSPEYNILSLKTKRNCIAAKICINMMMDEDNYEEFFKNFTANDFNERLPDVTEMSDKIVHKFDWENSFWEEILQDYQTINFIDNSKCSVHESTRYCPREKNSHTNTLSHNTEKLLDNQFRFLLHLTQPMVNLLGSPTKTPTKNRTCQWIEKLCTIHCNTKCIVAKGVRNDYMTCLVGYLYYNELPGPFAKHPGDELIPLPLAAKYESDNISKSDPSHPLSEEFMKNLQNPDPDEGAFALISVTGDLCVNELYSDENSKLNEKPDGQIFCGDSSITLRPISVGELKNIQAVLMTQFNKNRISGLNYNDNVHHLKTFAEKHLGNYDKRIVMDEIYKIDCRSK